MGPVPAVFMRGGTSKGVFLHERDLPPAGAARDALLLRIMGSPDPYGRQLDGMGGGISSLSKVIVVRTAREAGAEIEYIHGQVSVDQAVVDWSANCGNLSGAVGPFAIDEGLVAARAGTDGLAVVRLRNLNSGTLIQARVPVREGRHDPVGDFAVAGVAGTGARVALDYLRPGLGGTATLFPTGAVREVLEVGGRRFAATLAAAAMPMVWLLAEEVGVDAAARPEAIEADEAAMVLLDALRRAGAVRMGLAPDAAAAKLASPKVGVVAAPRAAVALDGRPIAAGEADLLARVVSMERVHRAIPLTGAMCLAAAVLAEGSVPHDCAGAAPSRGVRVSTPSGVVTVDALLGPGTPPVVERVTTYSTARRLFDGRVWP
jgi:2-methylaconitate cis-trans-isomerase PrpF